jgi:sodium/hydrogen exchanger-like protein 6/7/sodium/hydrogen exchanger 8
VQVTVHAHVSLDCSYVEFFFYTQSCRLKTRGHWRINRYEFAIIFFSGLIRGPVAYALIQNFNPQGGLTSQVVMESTTIFLIVLTTLVIGGLLKYFLDWSFYAIEQNPTYTMDHPSIRESVLRNTLTQQEADLKMYKQFTSKSQSIFQRIDENFLKPTLIYNYKHRREDILEAKR